MAADLDTKPSVPKYEAFIDNQLAKVRTRIRALDAGRSLMMLVVITLAYFLAMAAFDLAVGGADGNLVLGIRLAAFAIYVLLATGFLVQLVLHLYRRINPYYAARQLEETIDDPKNSVINWLDLKGRELPGAIRIAVGQRAARELKETDADKAVSPRGNWLLGGILAGLVVGMLALFVMGPNQFPSLLKRAFTPFVGSGLGTRTEITLLKPESGDATVPLGRPVEFHANISGRYPKLGQPGAPRLLYRYQQADPFVPLALDDPPDGTWTTSMLADQVQNGFWYKIAAGDAETPEYQIKVQSLPQATRFEVTYHYRPYRRLADDRVIFPNEQAVLPRLRDFRGTAVTLVVRTNRELSRGHVEMETGGIKSELSAEILGDDRRALRVDFVLDKSGTFRVKFTSKDGEDNSDRGPYQIDVLEDKSPYVELTKPGQDVSLSPNGTLQLEGTAQDDIGIKSMRLRLKVFEGESRPALKSKEYRPGKSFQFDNGTFPDFLAYKDFVALDQIKTEQGDLLAVKPGMILEYWLEARDSSDYPSKDGNLGISKSYKVTIEKPRDDKKQPDDKKQKDDRKKTEDQQRDHEQQQDQKNAQENQKRNEGQGQGKNESKEDQQKQKDFEKKLDQARNELSKDDNKQKAEPKKDDSNSGPNKDGNSGNKSPEQLPPPKNDQQNAPKKDGPKGDGNPKDRTEDPASKDKPAPKPGGEKGKGDEKPPQAKNDNNQQGKPEKKDELKNGPDSRPDSKKGSDQKAEPKTAKGDEKKDAPPQPENPNQPKGSDKDQKPDLKKEKGSADVGKKGEDTKGPDTKDSKLTKNKKENGDKGAGGKSEPANGDLKKTKDEDPQTKQAKGSKDGKEETKKDSQNGGSGPNGTPPPSDNSADDPSRFKRGADLQLETLKERMTPEHLKNLGWTQQEWEQFLKDAQAYEANRQKLVGPGAQKMKGGNSSLPSSPLRPIDTNPNAQIDSLQTDRALPPPEFRDAQNRFTKESGK